MRYKFAFLTAASLLALCLGSALLPAARAQQGQTSAAAPAGAGYRLGTGDIISIQVINFSELSVPQITVPPDGKITVPLLGSLSVAGKTTDQVAQTLTKKWSDYVADPAVTVTLAQKRKESVHIYGFVTHALTVEYQSDLHLMQALAQAGGAADNGDLSQVTVTHKGGGKQTVDLSNPQAAGGTDQDLALAPDDVIYVPERHVQISVLGEVVKPGSYDYKDKMNVLEALKDADNVNPETADLSNATLLHDGKESRLDLNALLHLGQTAGNIALAPGDRIFVPTLHNRVYVDGAVGRAGYYAFKPGNRLADAISGSGGTLAGISDLKNVSVIHQNKRGNTATAQTVDFGRFLQKGDMTANIPLAPDDAIYIPIKGKKVGFGEVLQSLIGVGALASGVRGL